MTETLIDTSEKNINLETVENCNLLCKLILDYMDTDKCVIQRLAGQSFRIVYPEGSFINHKDTNFELTYAYFFYPSRHSIDGQKYDLEINLYHGNFRNQDQEIKGMVAHTHYHNDDTDTNLHKHFHYHLPDDEEKDLHIDDIGIHSNKNVITCLMYNKGKHDGSDLNIFFNQFVHHPDFRSFANRTSGEKEIQVHDHWSIEKIYPKKRSFFIYDDNNTGNTFVVFDTIQTISKELIDRLYVRGIKGSTGYDISNSPNFDIETPDRVMYRKNIEVITDAAYKRSMRAQIKDLLSLTRMSTYKPSSRTSREYNEIGDSIIDSYVNGDNVGFFANEDKSKEISKMWDFYAKDLGQELHIDDLTPADKDSIDLSTDSIKKYKYLDNILTYEGFKHNAPSDYSTPEWLKKDEDGNIKQDYFSQRESLMELFDIWWGWKETVEVEDDVPNFPFKNVSIIGYTGDLGTEISTSLFRNMLNFYQTILIKFIVSNDDNANKKRKIASIQGIFTGNSDTDRLGNTDLLRGATTGVGADVFFDTVEKIYQIISKDDFPKWADRKISLDEQIDGSSFWDDPPELPSIAGGHTDYSRFRDQEFVKRIYNPSGNGNYKNVMSANGLSTYNSIKDLFEKLNNCKELFKFLSTQTDGTPKEQEIKKVTNLRIFFEDIDENWKTDNGGVISNMYQRLITDYPQNTTLEILLGNTNPNYKNILKKSPSPALQGNFGNNRFVFVKIGDTLNRTISNEECQPWLSNQVHYEGDLWKFWEKNIKVGPDEKFTWDKFTPIYKEKIRDGLIRWNGSSFDDENGRWETHNQCRNPGNRAAAPWCYTKNPNKRWEYCQKPYYSNILGKIILFFIFIAVGIIAYFTIKTLFLHEYPMRFVEKITGGKMASTETFAAGTSTAGAPTAGASPTAGATPTTGATPTASAPPS